VILTCCSTTLDQLEGLENAIENIEADLHEYGVYADVDIMLGEEDLDVSDDNEDEAPLTNEHVKYKNMTETQRQQIYAALLAHSRNGKLKKNTTAVIADLFNVKSYTVRSIWRIVKKCHTLGLPVDVSSKKKKNCGRKKPEVDLSQVATIPLDRRSTIRSLAERIGVKRSTLHRWFKKGMLRRHSNTLKPCLKEENRKSRLQFCVSMLDQHTTLQTEPKFIDMCNIIHIDEKWFNATKKSKNFYMLPEEEDPHRTVQNKNNIDKVMVLSGVGKPTFEDQNNCIFDGKIGVWPFVRQVSYKFYCCPFFHYIYGS
jgi:hypothetical protein